MQFLHRKLFKNTLSKCQSFRTMVLKQHDLLKNEFEGEGNKTIVSRNALENASWFGFYLGIDSTWLYK